MEILKRNIHVANQSIMLFVQNMTIKIIFIFGIEIDMGCVLRYELNTMLIKLIYFLLFLFLTIIYFLYVQY